MDKIILKLAEISGISDIHLSANKAISIRVNGLIDKKDEKITKNDEIEKFIQKTNDKIIYFVGGVGESLGIELNEREDCFKITEKNIITKTKKQ